MTSQAEHADRDPDRPRPGPARGRHAAEEEPDVGEAGDAGGGEGDYRQDESQDYVDRSVIDFDPAEGLYTGTAVTGESDIPGTGDDDSDEEGSDSETQGS